MKGFTVGSLLTLTPFALFSKPCLDNASLSSPANFDRGLASGKPEAILTFQQPSQQASELVPGILEAHGHDHGERHRFEGRAQGSDQSPEGSELNHGSDSAPRRPKANQGQAFRFGRVTDGEDKASSGEQCESPPIQSCSTKAQSADSCCVVKPGGVLVHTQFWDKGIGEATSWGIHGLWPDKCNGQFYENCDQSRAYSASEIAQTIQCEDQDLYDFMQTHWQSNDDSPEQFWSHEWSTHGTCVSTLEPQCFENYQRLQEVTPYFQTVVNLFKKLNVYDGLQQAGITPSESQTYSLQDLQDAIINAYDVTPDFVCKGHALSSIQFYFLADGPLQNSAFSQGHATRSSNCPKTGIQYPLKYPGGQNSAS